MNQFNRSKIQGFSLIEALIAALIVGIGIIGLARLQGITLSNSSESRTRTDALNLAQKKIEELRSFSNQTTYDNLADGTNANTETIMAGGNANFTRTWTITACANSMNCKQAKVTVAWTDSSGEAQTVKLTSFITQTDPVKAGIVLVSAIPSGVGGTAAYEAIANDKIIQATEPYSDTQKSDSKLAKDAAVAAAGQGDDQLAVEKAAEVQAIYDYPSG